MGFLDQVLKRSLKLLSGNFGVKLSEQLLFDKVIGFKGITSGVGTSTIVQNTAIALSETTNYSVCVLDTNFLYPAQYPLLAVGRKKDKDYLDFVDELSDVSIETAYKNIYLFSLNDRTILDMLSTKDSADLIDNLVHSLKSYFDIILVDLSHEMTNLSSQSAVKCNRIFYVTDQSVKSIYYLKKSINNMATLAIPFSKANRIIVNKTIPDVVTNTKGTIEEAGLSIVGEIPLSVEIAKNGVSGDRLWSDTSSNKEIFIFSSVINSVVDLITVTTPANEKYMDKSLDTDDRTDSSGNSDSNYSGQEENIEDDFISEEESIDDDFIEDDVVESDVVIEEPQEPIKQVKEKPKKQESLQQGVVPEKQEKQKKEKRSLFGRKKKEEAPTFGDPSKASPSESKDVEQDEFDAIDSHLNDFFDNTDKER